MLNCKEIKLINLKGNQSWIFIGRTDAETETPVLCPPEAKNWLIWKDPDARKDWGQEEKRTTEDEMIGWHHRLIDMGLGGLRELVMDREAWRCGSWGRKESDTTERLNWTEYIKMFPGIPWYPIYYLSICKGRYCTDFFYNRLVLLILELHTNEIRWYALFYMWSHLFNTMSMKPTLLHVIEIYPFYCSVVFLFINILYFLNFAGIGHLLFTICI